jgi:hypothetical protein
MQIILFYRRRYYVSAIDWTMIMLSMHPEWQEKAHNEVLLIVAHMALVAPSIGRIETNFINTIMCREGLDQYQFST